MKARRAPCQAYHRSSRTMLLGKLALMHSPPPPRANGRRCTSHGSSRHLHTRCLPRPALLLLLGCAVHSCMAQARSTQGGGGVPAPEAVHMMRAEESDTPREEATTLIEAQDGHSDQAVAEDEPATLTQAAEAERRNKEDCINDNLLGRLTPAGQGEHSWRTTTAAHPCLAKICCPGCCTRARAMRHHRSYEGCMYFFYAVLFSQVVGRCSSKSSALSSSFAATGMRRRDRVTRGVPARATADGSPPAGPVCAVASFHAGCCWLWVS